MNEFDRIAPFYDGLARLVFGNRIRMAQREFLHEIPDGSKVLILGGGTGHVLRELVFSKPACRVWYVETSEAMLNRAKRHAGPGDQRRIFIHGSQDDLPLSVSYDVVIMQFYLDMFTVETMNSVIAKLKTSLHHDSILIVADFVNTTWWHGAMLRMMYKFFKAIARINASRLNDWNGVLKGQGFSDEATRYYYRGFIKASLYRRRV